MGDIELPVLPDIADLEVPEFPIKSVFLLFQIYSDFPCSNPRRVNQKKKKTKKGRELIEDSIVGLISSGLRHLSADLNSEDDQHQDFPEYD